MSLSKQRARPAISGREFAQSQAANLPKELFTLLRQVGSTPIFGLSADSSKAGSGKDFLQNYVTRLLVPVELPAIAEACGHAIRGELRELIAQDLRLAEQAVPSAFADASRRTGRFQLARLRPLRDERIAQRYLAAVESGRAHGWHTIVYGVTMALYSLPLRQGLLHYGRETVASLEKNLSESADAGQIEALMQQVPAGVETALARY